MFCLYLAEDKTGSHPVLVFVGALICSYGIVVPHSIPCNSKSFVGRKDKKDVDRKSRAASVRFVRVVCLGVPAVSSSRGKKNSFTVIFF